jgi:hypothetical protein
MDVAGFKIPPVIGKQGPAVLTNKKQENFDQTHAKNPAKGSCIRINHKKYKIFFSEEVEHLKNLKTLYDPYLGLDPLMHVNKNPIHLVAQSLSLKCSQNGFYE